MLSSASAAMIAALYVENGGCYTTPIAFRDLLIAIARTNIQRARAA